MFSDKKTWLWLGATTLWCLVLAATLSSNRILSL